MQTDKSTFENSENSTDSEDNSSINSSIISSYKKSNSKIKIKKIKSIYILISKLAVYVFKISIFYLDSEDKITRQLDATINSRINSSIISSYKKSNSKIKIKKIKSIYILISKLALSV